MVVLLVVASVWIAVSCGGRSSTSLSAAIRTPAISVGGLSLPEPSNGGEPFVFRAQPGGLLLVYFGYTSCPDVCPTTLAGIRTALAKDSGQADKIGLAMATIDPGHDTDSMLRDYVTGFLPSGHALRTTDQALLESVTSPFGASYSVTTNIDGTSDVSHTPFVYAVNDQGELIAQWPFGIKPSDLARDLRILLADPTPKATT